MELTPGPVGVFDSGIGGLTVVREIFRLLPEEPVLFFGDTARLPYGPKSRETVIRFARQNARFLLSRGVSCIVVACNTASSVALPFLEKEVSLPVIGVIEPGAGAAARATKNKRVGVIGTRGTVASGAYDRALAGIDESIRVYSEPCPLLVPLAEEGWIDHPVTFGVIREYLEPLLAESIDTLILGCTHFPVLKNAIQEVVGEGVTIVDSARETALLLGRRIGSRRRPGAKAKHHYVVSDVPLRFREEAELFLGEPIPSVERVDLELLEETCEER